MQILIKYIYSIQHINLFPLGKCHQILLATSQFTIILFVCPPKFCVSIVSSFSLDLQGSQEKTKTMLVLNLRGQTNSVMVFSKMAC